MDFFEADSLIEPETSWIWPVSIGNLSVFVYPALIWEAHDAVSNFYVGPGDPTQTSTLPAEPYSQLQALSSLDQVF